MRADLWRVEEAGNPIEPADDACRSAVGGGTLLPSRGNLAQLADSRARVPGQQLQAWLNHSLEQ
jgi:hypothetical protein